MAEVVLDTKNVDEIEGEFIVPAYQRGYRWGELEVRRLLDDLKEYKEEYSNDKHNYCLQPLVVKKIGEKEYELIDGQQRLTTIFLIYKYIMSLDNNVKCFFKLNYQTREGSGKFLESEFSDDKENEPNIDFHYIHQAYKTIEKWFEDNIKYTSETRKTDEFRGYGNYLISMFKKDTSRGIVNVIWYEADDSQNSIDLFRRLNVGKIPLTNAELVKAKFLCESKEDVLKQQISFQWNSLERELQNNNFWYFLTNEAEGKKYQTRMDLILELCADSDSNGKDPYATFFYFDNELKKEKVELIWGKIQKTFLKLKSWYEDHEFYHKIGYLIASGHKTLRELYSESNNKKNSEYKNLLDDYIKESIALPKEQKKKNGKEYSDLSYENKNDFKLLYKILLLFNVESVRVSGEKTARFPFEKLKSDKWTLEHIHAQNSDRLGKETEWKEWLEEHSKLLKEKDSDLYKEIKEKLKKTIAETDFNQLSQNIFKRLGYDEEEIHTISNLALLQGDKNTVLSNSVFAAKRKKIIEMDKKGDFIPLCTRNVFLKYYNEETENNDYWGENDRRAYEESMSALLKKYGFEVK